MKSMTGFGRGSAAGEGFSVSVELKTVNNRFLDVHVRAGSELAGLEAGLRRRIGERLSRGRVEVSVNLDRTSEVTYEVNPPLVAGYIQAMRAMQQEFWLSGEPDVNVLARLPGALPAARDGVTEAMARTVEAALASALDDLEAMREREGASLAAEMRSRLDEIERHVPLIEALAGE